MQSLQLPSICTGLDAESIHEKYNEPILFCDKVTYLKSSVPLKINSLYLYNTVYWEPLMKGKFDKLDESG